MALTEETMNVMRSMKLSGSSWVEIAAIFGYSPDTMRSYAPRIMMECTNSDKISKTSLGKSIATYVALTSESDETKLKAAKLLDDGLVEKEGRPIKKTTIIMEEILKELDNEIPSE